MADYIKREDALSEVEEWEEEFVECKYVFPHVRHGLKKIPAADVREVVHCDGCIYHIDNGNHYCRRLHIDCPLSDFYCAFGKRGGANNDR